MPSTRPPGAADGGGEENTVLFMVIEKFRDQDAKPVYRRFHDKGRLMPEGLAFVSSWVAADLGRCFQVVDCEDVALLQRWAAAWSDLIEFEIVPVMAGEETAEALAEQPSGSSQG